MLLKYFHNDRTITLSLFFMLFFVKDIQTINS
jgi:hypothetical protein